MQELETQYKKSGFMGGAVGAIVGLIVGVGVATLVLIFVGVMGGKTYNIVESDIQDISGYTGNETITAVSSATNTLAHGSISATSFKLVNASVGGATVNAGNYSLDAAHGKITWIAGSYYNGVNVNASYSYGDSEIETSVIDGIKAGFESQKQTGELMPLIVLAIVITIVLALILSLGRTGGSSGGTAL